MDFLFASELFFKLKRQLFSNYLLKQFYLKQEVNPSVTFHQKILFSIICYECRQCIKELFDVLEEIFHLSIQSFIADNLLENSGFELAIRGDCHGEFCRGKKFDCKAIACLFDFNFAHEILYTTSKIENYHIQELQSASVRVVLNPSETQSFLVFTLKISMKMMAGCRLTKRVSPMTQRACQGLSSQQSWRVVFLSVWEGSMSNMASQQEVILSAQVRKTMEAQKNSFLSCRFEISWFFWMTQQHLSLASRKIMIDRNVTTKLIAFSPVQSLFPSSPCAYISSMALTSTQTAAATYIQTKTFFTDSLYKQCMQSRFSRVWLRLRRQVLTAPQQCLPTQTMRQLRTLMQMISTILYPIEADFELIFSSSSSKLQLKRKAQKEYVISTSRTMRKTPHMILIRNFRLLVFSMSGSTLAEASCRQLRIAKPKRVKVARQLKISPLKSQRPWQSRKSLSQLLSMRGIAINNYQSWQVNAQQNHLSPNACLFSNNSPKQKLPLYKLACYWR